MSSEQSSSREGGRPARRDRLTHLLLEDCEHGSTSPHVCAAPPSDVPVAYEVAARRMLCG